MSRLAAVDLLPKSNYAVQVRAIGPNGNTSEWSPRVLFQTLDDVILPATPDSLTFVSVGDGFHAEWNPVLQNLAGEIVAIDRYEVELVTSGGTVIRTASQVTTTGKVVFDLSFEENIAAFTTPQATITVRVRAVDTRGLTGAWTTGVSASNPPPATPVAAATPVTTGTNNISLLWLPVVDRDLVGYNVYVGSTAGFATTIANRQFQGNSTQFTYVSGTYTLQYFKIRAYDKFGQESGDLVLSGTADNPFVVDTVAPVTPTSVTASIVNNTNGVGATATVAWVLSPSPSDLSGFRIRYRKVGASGWSQTTTDTGLTATVPVDAYTNYDFAVQAFDGSGNNSAFSAVTTATSPAAGTPANVTGFISTAGKDSITYNWTPTGDLNLKNYEVTFSTSPTFASSNLTFLTGSSTTLTVAGLTASTTYYARVRAVNVAGTTSAAWSGTDTKATTAFPTTPLTDGLGPQSSPTPLVSPGLGNLYITWPAITLNSAGGAQLDPVTYEVHLSTTSGFTPVVGTKVSETPATFAVVDLLPGTSTALSYGVTYYVKLVAKDRDAAAAAGAQGSGSLAKVNAIDSNLTPADIGAPTTAQFSTLTSTVDTSIKQYVTEYSVNVSETVAPLTGWSTATPTRTPGTYIWFRVTVTYNNNTTTTTNPALLTGNAGAQGIQGNQGTPAADISLNSTSQVLTAPAAGGATNPATAVVTGTAVNTTITSWTYSVDGGAFSATLPAGVSRSGNVVTITGASVTARTITVAMADAGGISDTLTVARVLDGATGTTGTPGVGITGTTVTYQIHTNGTTAPTGTWNASPTATTTGQFLWTRTVTTYSNSTSSTAYSVSAHGNTGSTGSTGVGVSGTTVTYQVGSSATAAPTGTWLSAPAATTPGTFLWTRTITSYTDSSSATGYSVSAHGTTGNTGAPGNDAYTVILTNEAQVFAATTNGAAVAGSAATTVIAYKAAVQQVATIGTITGLPTGMTAAITNNGTATATVTFTVTTSLVTQTGTVTIPVTVGGIAFTKTFSYSLSLQGATGSQGIQGNVGNAGATGTSITSVTPYFYQIATGSAAPALPAVSPPNAPWTGTEPGYVVNTELYRTERIVYSTGTFVYTPVSKVSAYTAAVTAVTTANGKNKSTYAISAPTVNDAGVTGDIWFVRAVAAGSPITAQYESTGGTAGAYSWVTRTLNDTVIANMTFGKLTGGDLQAQTLRLSTGGYLQSTDFSTGLAGWRLGTGGLEINNGSIRARALNVSIGGGNLFPDSSFETTAYGGPFLNCTWNTTTPRRGTRSLRLSRVSVGDAYTATASNIPIAQTLGQRVMVSWDWKQSVANAAVDDWPALQNDTYDAYLPVTMLPGTNYAGTNWTRVVGYIDIPSNVTGTNWRVVIRAATTVGQWLDYDGFQIEIGDVATAWSPKPDEILPGTITGDMLQVNTAIIKDLYIGSGGRIMSTAFDANNGFQLNQNGLIIRGNGNQISGYAIDAQTITARQLTLSDPQNYAIDFNITANRVAFPGQQYWVWNQSGEANGNWRLNFIPTGVDNSYYTMPISDMFQVSPGDQFRGAMEAFRFDTNYNGGIYITFFSQVDAFIDQQFLTATTGGPNQSWTPWSGDFTVPTGAYKAQIRAIVHAVGSGVQTGQWYIRNVTVKRKYAGSLIVDGAIEGQHLKANTALVTNLFIGSGGTIQSTNWNGSSTGWLLGTAGLTIFQGAIKADTIIGGTWGSTTGRITIAAGANLMVSGGVGGGSIYSSTYNGSTAPGYYFADTNATAGFYLGDDGLIIAQGKVKAEALYGGTFNAGMIVLGANGYLASSNWNGSTVGWRLDSTGLIINNGTIRASALDIRTGGENLLGNSSFDNQNYDGWGLYNNTAGSEPSTASFVAGRTGGYALRHSWTGTNTSTKGVFCYNTNYVDNTNKTKPNSTYIVSFYARASSNVQFGLYFNVGPTLTWLANPVAASSFWQRYIVKMVTSSSADPYNFYISIINGTVATGWVDIDDIQLEEGDVVTAYSPSSTFIDGSSIRTGALISTNLTGIGGTPMWSIPMNGAATFQNLTVRGASVLGVSGDSTSSSIQSANWDGGLNGWKIDAAGNATLNQAIIRGTVYASGGSFTGAITATSGTFTGTIYASAGSFSGAVTATSGTVSGNLLVSGSMVAGAAIGSGERIIIRQDGSGGIIESFSGIANEVAGSIDPSAVGPVPALTIKSGATPTYLDAPFIQMYAGSANNSWMQFDSARFTIGRSNTGIITNLGGVMSLYTTPGGTLNIQGYNALNMYATTFNMTNPTTINMSTGNSGTMNLGQANAITNIAGNQIRLNPSDAIYGVVVNGVITSGYNITTTGMVTHRNPLSELRATANQTFVTGWQVITYNTGTVRGTITQSNVGYHQIGVTGWYQVEGFTRLNTPAYNVRVLLRIEAYTTEGLGLGTMLALDEPLAPNYIANSLPTMKCSGLVYLTAGTYIRMILYSGAAGTFYSNLDNSAFTSKFTCYMV